MRLGELRTKTKELDNGLFIRLSVYEDIVCNSDGFVELELDVVTDDSVYLRGVNDG